MFLLIPFNVQNFKIPSKTFIEFHSCPKNIADGQADSIKEYSKTVMSILVRSCNVCHLSQTYLLPGRVAHSVARLIQEPEVPGSKPGPATYFGFSVR